VNKNVLIICCGYPFGCDLGFGYHVGLELEKLNLPEKVEVREVGFSACMIPDVIEGKDKLIVIDIFRTGDEPGTVVRLKTDEVPLTVDRITDVSKTYLIDTLKQISLYGKCPETVFVGVVPKDTKTESEELTDLIKSKIPSVIKIIMEEINR
jgi:hydrogenase maturation protease